jgi:hypothetical protein
LRKFGPSVTCGANAARKEWTRTRKAGSKLVNQ